MRVALLLGLALLTLGAAACSGASEAGSRAAPAGETGYVYPDAPPVPEGSVEPAVGRAVEKLLAGATSGVLAADALAVIARSKDARLGWVVSDLLRFYQGTQEDARLVEAFTRLTGVDVKADPLFEEGSWRSVTDHLLTWELPAAPGYTAWKATVFLAVEPRWGPFFADKASGVDWRRISWGGVLIDDRPRGDPDPCPRGCIPALDDPPLTSAAEGAWYPDERDVFGIVVGGEAVAFPKNVMEVHELVNIEIGGRRLGIPYCTLCASAQAYLLDRLPAGVDTPVLRTTGLLSRSNKVMYDLVSKSLIDTFTGRAVSGPLHRARATFPQVTVVTSTWAAWKRAHPATRIVARDGGIGRSYPLDPLAGRDDDGPIFPVGDVDPRLPVQAKVVGVLAPDGAAVAFAADEARAALRAGETVALNDIELVGDGGGLRAVTQDGAELPAHEAFWFAWSQFHPGTNLWVR